MRYLAELPWVPEAMLHNRHLRWKELKEDVIEVSADSAGGLARVRLQFQNGDVVRAEADDRPRAEGNRIVPSRWEGRFWDYREVSGRRIPVRAEVSWLLDDGRFSYWRCEILAAEVTQ
jgi:hypothetical protein